MPRSRHTLLVAGIVLGGCLLRALFLSHDALWVDEAESAINALTILEHGYPTDHYLGMPIYENTLVRPWPESEEYEFKDISYSRRGMAIYHGWLPLYAIAAALSAAGFAPDQPAETPVATHAAAELTRRTVVPRLPSLAFSAVFLLCLYRLGRELQGRELGLAVLLAAACCEPVVWFGWQARYYAATLAFSAATALWILKLGKDRRLSTAAVLGLLLVLLFHCHSLSFLIMAAVLACSLPRCLAQPRPLLRLGVLGAIVAAGTVPWMIATGFLGEAPAIPMAWTLLGPHDFAAYALRFPTLSLVVGLGLAAPLITRFCSRRLPPQTASALAERQGTLTFASPWLLIALLAFSFLIPAASHFTRRLTLVLVIPGLLLTASMLSTALRVLRGKASPAWTSLATAGLLLALGKLPFSEKQGSFGAEVPHLVAMVNRWPLRPGTKLYATPNDHLVMTYYTGLPFQSIAAVRRSFLDSYPGDVIILEGQSADEQVRNPFVNGQIVSPNYFRVMEIPLRSGRSFTDDDRAGNTPVAVLSRPLAERLFGSENPVGKRIKLPELLSLSTKENRIGCR